MSLFNAVIEARNKARVESDKEANALLSTLLGDLQNKFLKPGKTEATDDEVIATINSYIKNIGITVNAGSLSTERLVSLQYEQSILESFLPKQLSMFELSAIINAKTAEGLNRGQVMKFLKDNYFGRYNASIVSNLFVQ